MRQLCLANAILWLTAASVAAENRPADKYDPLQVAAQPSESKPLELEFHDQARNRDLPLLAYLPEDKAPAPVVLFSHGLGGNRYGSAFLGRHWSARGYVAVFVQHPGSDDTVWKGAALGERVSSLKGAGNLENSLLRFRDIPAVLDQLTAWNQQAGHALHGRLDLDKVGMSGHSYGAVTTQAVSGQRTPLGTQPFLEPRIKAAIAFSPRGVIGRETPEKAFGGVRIPWLLMTGTDDSVDLFGQTAESRLTVFPGLPAGSKYELVLSGAEHSAFTERPLPGDRNPRNPHHHRSILALSTAFWDAYLKHDPAAQTWLDGPGPRSVLDADDQWQKK